MSHSVISDLVQALLETEQRTTIQQHLDDHDEEEEIERRQARLCGELLVHLQTATKLSRLDHDSNDAFLRRRYLQDDDEEEEEENSSGSSRGATSNNERNSNDEHINNVWNIRSILGPHVVTSSTMSRLVTLLVDGMAHRVDASELLPLTYDEEANQQALLDTAITLTPWSLISAELYAHLLSVPGALGAGLVDLGALQALSAVVERWASECRGKEKEMSEETNLSTKEADVRHGNNKRRTELRPSKAASRRQPIKRKKQSPRSKEYISSSDDDDDDDDDDEMNSDDELLVGDALVVDNVEMASTAKTLTPSQLVLRGLQVACQVACLPTVRDFFSWSEEARDVIFSTTVTALATSTALQTASKKLPAPLHELVERAAGQSSTGLIECVPLAMSDALDSDTLTKRVHATKAILKGLHSLLLYQREVPMGQKGKQVTAEAATNVLERLIASIATDMEENPHSWPKNPMDVVMSPSAAQLFSPTTPGTANALQTPQTANKTQRRTPFSNKKRLSAGGKPTTPLRLKSATKSPSTASLLSPAARLKSSSSSTHHKPRHVLREILALMQRLMLDPAIETAATRHHVVETVNRCIPHLPSYERGVFVACLGTLLQSKWWYCRQVSCEVSTRVLRETWFWETSEVALVHHAATQTPAEASVASATPSSVSQVGVPNQRAHLAETLLEGLVGRLNDKDRNLRISCANGLTLLFQTFRSDSICDGVKDRLVQLLSKQLKPLARVLRESCLHEDKALAKKAFIGALVELLATSHTIDELDPVMDMDDVLIFSRFCQDASQETRRAAAEALTTLLEAAQRNASDKKNDMLLALEMAWSESVLPLALEADSRLASKLLSLFDRIVFQPIVDDEESSAPNRSAWRIVVDAAAQSEGVESLSTLLRRKVSESQSRGDVLRPLMTTISNVASSITLLDASTVDQTDPVFRAQRDGVWCLFKAMLSSTSSVTELIRPLKKNKRGLGLVVDCWHKMATSLAAENFEDEGNELLRSFGQCLEVITALAPQFDVGVAEDAADSIEGYLTTFSLPKSAIGFAVTALAALTVSLKDSQDVKVMQKRCANKVRALFEACEKEIASNVRSEVSDDSESRLIRALFTAGELCLVGFSEDEDGTSGSAATVTKSKSDPLVGIHERPSSRLVQLVQTLLSPTVPNSDSVATPPVIRSLAFLTLGKMCIRDESLTIQSVTLFARELYEAGNGSPDVQANALVVLGDLCVRFANHVDRFLPVMATCLQAGVHKDMDVLDAANRNGFELVRVQAVHLLSNLIMQDYIKWRGLLFHRFLVASADDAEHVSFVAQRTLCGPLLNKKPQLFMQNFVESLFVLNRCTTHPMYKAASMSGDGGSGTAVDFEGIYLDGSLGSERRHTIYRMMLSKMSDEQKIGVTARLAKDVLGHALEHGNDLHRLCNFANPEGLDLENHPSYARPFSVLRDALTILRSKLTRVSRSKDQEVSASDVASRRDRVASLKGEFLSNINRIQLIDIIVPILARLKATLQKNRSPLLQDLMGYLLVVFDAYPDQVRDILGNEPQILAEIEYDARAAKRSKQILRESNSITS